MSLTDEQANRIYDILVRNAGADNRSHYREMFVVGVTNPKMREYRFIGDLGFGGKFWNSDGKWYVTAYGEDIKYYVLSDRAEMITNANAALAGLKVSYDALSLALEASV